MWLLRPVAIIVVLSPALLGQQFVAETKSASEDELQRIQAKLEELNAVVAKLRQRRVPPAMIADVAIYSKAAEWILRHGEFYSDKYAGWTVEGLARGIERARSLENDGAAKWDGETGRLARGFVSKVDGSVQPYGLVIPPKYAEDGDDFVGRKWRLDVELHGRGATLNEVSFLHAHDSKQPVPDDQDFIQLDIFGRTNNAYRWAGETDVFEAIESVRRRYRIDDRRIVLRGFSMGGAGSWHLGLHHPDKWCSVGPGAGFTDTKKYQKITEPLPPWQEATLHIYDAEDYTLNAFNVPIVAYGGEDDPQLAASRGIKESLETLGARFTTEPSGLDATTADIPFLYLVGPKMGHQFHPESRKRAMAFHAEHAAAGTPYFKGRVRFVTYTLKYPGAFGYTVLRMGEHYRPAKIEAVKSSDGVVEIKTDNVRVFEVSRGVGSQARLGGEVYDISTAADGLLPTVLFEKHGNDWSLLDYAPSLGELRRNYGVKRPGLTGPIDDAFTGSFLCVRGSGEPWSPELAAYANWSLDRFAREWDKYLRGKLPAKLDTEVAEQDVADSNLVLFGDPGSNRVLRDLVARVPLKWTQQTIEFAGRSYSPREHAVVMICPSPLNARRYVVINSGHTFHEAQFRASNARLYPRLGDFAVMRFTPSGGGGFDEATVTAGIFDEQWQVPKN